MTTILYTFHVSVLEYGKWKGFGKIMTNGIMKANFILFSGPDIGTMRVFSNSTMYLNSNKNKITNFKTTIS